MTSIKKKKNIKPFILIGGIVLLIILIVILCYLLFFKSSDLSATRCSTDEYKVEKKIITSAKEKIMEIEQVDNVEIYKNVCILKIVINLKEDIKLDDLKKKMTEVIEVLGNDVNEHLDISLFVTSNNKESKTYPLNVSKHKSREDFAW